MTQDEIIVWAKEFGLQVKPPSWGYSDTHTIGNIYVEHLVAFAKLVAEAEREACAKLAICYDSEPWKHTPAYSHVADMVSVEIGKAIRARGQA